MSALAICHKQIGDLVLLEPALAKLAAASGQSVKLLTRSGHAPLISLMANVEMTARTSLRWFDGVFVYDDSRKSALRALLAISRKKSLVLREPAELTRLHRFVFNHLAAPGINDHYLASYGWDHTPVETDMIYRHPRLNPPPAAWRPPGFTMTDYLLLNSTGGWKRNRWSSGKWIQVLQGLLKHGVEQIVLTSGGQDWQIEHSQRIAAGMNGRVTFLGGKTKLEEYLWLTANGRMVLSIDGSAAHLAAAFGKKSFTLFFRSHAPTWHTPRPTSGAIIGEYDPETGKCDFPIEQITESVLTLWAR